MRACNPLDSVPFKGLSFFRLRLLCALKIQLKSGNDIIFTSNSVLVSFECSYDNNYAGIEATDVNVVGSNYTTDAGDADSNQGLFSFELDQYTDNSFNSTSQVGDVTQLGENFYFLLSMSNPVANLVYSIVGKFNVSLTLN